MAEYIELTEELILSMRAGARAISNTKKYHGTIYVADVFSENPKEMPYLKAAEILYAASEKKSADVAPVRHGRWIDRPTGRCGQWQAWCSACDKKCGCGGTLETQHKIFCPNCGAKMKGES